MKLTFNRSQCFSVPDELLSILNTTLSTIDSPDLNTTGIIFNFRDDDYSADRGGFHPVEIRLSKQNEQWQFEYITDFSFLGHPYPELVKEIDVCFNTNKVYQLFIGWIENNADADELVNMLLTNFVSYVGMSVFTVTVSFDPT
jgi:hypothetical protein